MMSPTGYCNPDIEGYEPTLPIPLCSIEPTENEDGSLSFDPVPTCDANSSPACRNDDDGSKSVTCLGIGLPPVCVNNTALVDDDPTDPPADDVTVPPTDDVTVPPADDVTAPPADDAAVEDSDEPPPSNLVVPYDDGNKVLHNSKSYMTRGRLNLSDFPLIFISF